VDWEARQCDKEFKDWLDRTAVWINEGKAKLEAEAAKAHPTIDFNDILKLDPVNAQELYKEVYRIEELIKQTDEAILVQLIKYRDYFWT
jgi:hypothetical protein